MMEVEKEKWLCLKCWKKDGRNTRRSYIISQT